MQKIIQTLKSVLHYFETGDLVPFLVVVSIAHFVGALANRDALPVALAVGIAVDVGMYRVIKAALKHGAWWWLAAILVTVMSFAYHLEYYGVAWQNVLFAAPLPLLIIMLAALSHQEKWSTNLARGTKAARPENANGTPTAAPVEPAAQTAQETKPRGTYAQFKMAQLALNGAGPMQAAQICDTFGVPKRTAYNWLARYDREVGTPHHAEVN